VIGPQSTDLDVFYTLPTSIGVAWDFEYLLLERERFTLELVPDVHRAHGIRNAIVVVVPSAPIGYVRLGIANAWREGVRRFILLFADRQQPTEFATDELEQELRVLLDSLGDGGAAPCLRTALTRCAGRTTKDMQDAMLRLLDEIERVFPPDDDAPVVDAPLPRTFANEEATLDAVLPLVRSGTLIEQRAATLEETAALRAGTGGSHASGWPYLRADEAWPACPQCGRPAPCFMQFDMRDVLHTPPPTHRLFVVYRCDTCYAPNNVVVRHYDAPTAEGRRPIDRTAPLREDPQVIVMERLAFMLPDYEIVAEDPDIVAKLRAVDVDWGRLYWWAESCTGMGSLCIPDHLGGWQTSQYARVPTCACDAKLYLVASTQWGDYFNSVWACPVHPDLTLFTFHK